MPRLQNIKPGRPSATFRTAARTSAQKNSPTTERLSGSRLDSEGKYAMVPLKVSSAHTGNTREGIAP